MTTKLSINDNNIITIRDSWAYDGVVTVEETTNGMVKIDLMSPERATNLIYDLLGSGWRVIEHSY